MSVSRIEDMNVTVTDSERAAGVMEAVFGWRARWRGPARDGGHTIRVGSPSDHIAFYTSREAD